MTRTSPTGHELIRAGQRMIAQGLRSIAEAEGVTREAIDEAISRYNQGDSRMLRQLEKVSGFIEAL